MVIKMDLGKHGSKRKRSEGDIFFYGEPNVDVQYFFSRKKNKKGNTFSNFSKSTLLPA